MSEKYKASRRSVIGGIGTGFFAFKSSGYPLSRRKKRIVVARDTQGPVEVEKMSKKWWSHRNHAHEVQDRLLERYKANEGVVGAGLEATENIVGGKRGFKIIIKLKDSSTGVEVPSAVEGVPIETEIQQERSRLGCYNDGPYSTLKGGIICADDPDDIAYATTGPMVKRNSTKYLLSCWHMYDEDSGDYHCEDIDGDPFYHQDTQYGNVVDSGHSNDWALVDVDSSNMTDGILTSHDNKVHTISAWFTEAGMDSAESDGRKFHRQGVTSGLTSGYIGNTNVDNTGPESCIDPGYCCTYTIDSASGDSGGPIFAWGKNDPDKAVLAGWVSWGEGPIGTRDGCTTDDLTIYEQIYGPIMDTIYDKYGISPVTG
jgi:hypothetical protein